MQYEPSLPLTADTQSMLHTRSGLPSLCWGAILGGTVAAIGIHILLTALGVGAGLATFSPITDTNPAASFSVGATIEYWSDMQTGRKETATTERHEKT